MPLKLVSPNDLTRAQVQALFARADEISQGATPDLARARVTLALFNTAFPLPLRRVDQVLAEAGAEVTAASASDPLSVHTANVILFSSPQMGSAGEGAEQVNASFLNAGDGSNENPVRALMDAYAIQTLKGDLQTNRIAILGNAKFSAEAHSLARLLGLFGARLTFITTAPLSMPYDLTDEVRLSAYEVEETNDLATTLRKSDALYLANIDPFRVEKKIFDKQKSFYTLTPETFAESKEGIVILGEWDGAESLLATTRPHVERAARAVLLALVEWTVS